MTQRTGEILGRIDGLDLSDDQRTAARPTDWTLRKRWRVTIVSCYATFIVGINSSSITVVSNAINKEFGVSDAAFLNSYWPVTTWNVGAALIPMLAVPLMEKYGFRRAYLGSYVVFTLFVFPQAFARNFATLVICRFMAGSFGGVIQDVMDGIIADVWPTAKERSLPVTSYVASLLLGVTLGPVFGGAITNTLGWRWVFYVQLILYGASLPVVWLAFEETRPHILARGAGLPSADAESATCPDVEESPGRLLYEAVVRPSHLLVSEPVVFFFTLLSALSFGLVFISTQSVIQVYTTLYAWEEWQAGLVQSAMAIGEVFGFLACILQNRIFAKRADADNSKSVLESTVPESRLYMSIPGSFVGLSGGLFWYAWTSYPLLHWIMPSVGLAFIGFGVMTVMQAIMVYITDAYNDYAGSASAAVCFGEQIFAAFLPLSAYAMYSNLGFQWASSLLGFIAMALSLAPLILIIKGRQIRRCSPFLCRA